MPPLPTNCPAYMPNSMPVAPSQPIRSDSSAPPAAPAAVQASVPITPTKLRLPYDRSSDGFVLLVRKNAYLSGSSGAWLPVSYTTPLGQQQHAVVEVAVVPVDLGVEVGLDRLVEADPPAAPQVPPVPVAVDVERA
jgi:hypothetical protein